MENKEELIDNLVAEYRQKMGEIGMKREWQIGDEWLRTALTLADKKGYMRGQKETLMRVVGDLYNVPPTGTVHPFDMIKAIEQYRQKLDNEAQAHDAISKLKEV